MNKTDKQQLRSMLKTYRSSLDAGQVEIKSHQIIEMMIENTDWSSIESVHTYLPINEKKEVDTLGLLKRIWDKYPGITTSTSIYSESRAIQHAIINRKTEFEEDSLGIPMPKSNFELQPIKCDLIIVPVLGFDKKLNRIGYGRGVYDSFLANNSEAQKTGLAYESSRVDSVPTEPHDVRLNAIFTEVKLYN